MAAGDPGPTNGASPATGDVAGADRADLGSAAALEDFAAEIADQVESFVLAVAAVARGDEPDSTLSMLLLQVSQLLLAGGRLGAITDVVPDEQFEADAGYEPDVDELRERLAHLLDPVDEYVEVHDPVDPALGSAAFLLSDELAGVCSELIHGLQHYRAGRVVEALWWWQFSYLSSWGASAGAVMRALHSLIAHTRLDADAVTADV